jgi:hypothetical protein
LVTFLCKWRWTKWELLKKYLVFSEEWHTPGTPAVEEHPTADDNEQVALAPQALNRLAMNFLQL